MINPILIHDHGKLFMSSAVHEWEANISISVSSSSLQNKINTHLSILSFVTFYNPMYTINHFKISLVSLLILNQKPTKKSKDCIQLMNIS